MASNSRSKRRSSIEPITVDELLSAAGMSGFVSFLNVKPEDYGRPSPAPPALEAASTVEAGLTSTVEAMPSSTVEDGPPSTVDAGVAATVEVEPASTVETGLASTVEVVPSSTVEDGPPSTVDAEVAATMEVESPTTVEDKPASTVVAGLYATVEAAAPSTVEGAPPSTVYWTIEGIGGVFPRSRLRRIERAQDVLTHVEESVYDVLWGVKDHSRDWSRQTSMGYEEIARRARASKRGVVDIIQRLIHKGFIEIISQPVTSGERRPTGYRVFSYAAVRKGQGAHNRIWTIRTGNGIGYAKPISVEVGEPSTVEAASASTVDAGKPSTMDAGKSSTVDPGSTLTSIGKNTSQNTTTTTALVAAIHEAMGRTDDDAAERIAEACRKATPGITDEEIAHFIRQEGPALRRNRALDNPMGVLIRHIPRCCRGESLRLYREAVRAERDRNRRQIDEWLEDARAILANPDASAMDRAWAEDILATYAGREGNG